MLRSVAFPLSLLLLLSSPGEAAKAKHALSVTLHGAKTKVARDADVTLTAKVNWRGPKADLRYEWKSLEGPPLPHESEGSTKLVIPAGELSGGDRYRILFRVFADWKDEEGEAQSTQAEGEIAFEVNTPPSGGKCTLDVRYPGPVQASVTLAAPGWKDDDQVQYRYVLVRGKHEVVVRNWSSAKSVQTASVARPGDTLQAKCQIRDKYGDGVVETSDPVTRPER